MGSQPHETPEEEQRRRLAELKRAEAAALRATALARTDPNVALVGYGLRLRGGKLTNEIVVTFHVREKVATDEEMLIMGSSRARRACPHRTGNPDRFARRHRRMD